VCDRKRGALQVKQVYDNVIHSGCLIMSTAMARKSRPITVTLGELQERVDARVQSGAYASASEVIRAAVRALDREEAALDGWLRERIEEALTDPRPNVPAREVFERLREHHAARVKAEENEKV
jgi:antitoxin ParD1/3/4